MSRSRRRAAAPARRIPMLAVAAVALGIAVAVVVAALWFVGGRSSGAQVPWTSFGTQDAHSLAFADAEGSSVLFGHHGGLSSSTDGGRTWTALAVRDDAMSLVPASDGSIVIAGHDVFVSSQDGGATWSPLQSDLPSLDIHGFTRDPADPARMWAYLATGGLWESTDYGARWTRVRDDNILFPLAVGGPGGTRLLGADPTGLAASDDGGATWTTLSVPETYPLTALAATPDGRFVYAGAPDALFRSHDGGRTWSRTGYSGSAFAIATTRDGQTVAVVSRETEYFRSEDGGATWPGP